MPKIVQLSEFGKWCETEGLSRADVQKLTGFSHVYVSSLFSDSNDKDINDFFKRFFYVWWDSVFTDAIKKKLLSSREAF